MSEAMCFFFAKARDVDGGGEKKVQNFIYILFYNLMTFYMRNYFIKIYF